MERTTVEWRTAMTREERRKGEEEGRVGRERRRLRRGNKRAEEERTYMRANMMAWRRRMRISKEAEGLEKLLRMSMRAIVSTYMHVILSF